MNNPLVSVVMGTFNDSTTYIKKAIESILNQSYKNFELIIVDDSTNPNTIRAIDSLLGDKRVSVIREKSRMGFPASLNEGIKISKGIYVARMDGDDIALPDRLQKQVAFLNNHEDISVVGSYINIINGSDDIISFRKYPLTDLGIFFFMIFRSPFAHPSVMMRKSILSEKLCYDPSCMRGEDLDLWLRLKKKGCHFANINENLLNYRVVGDLSDKRDLSQWKYVVRIRTKNFDIKHPISSLVSILVAVCYYLSPGLLKKIVYRAENSKISK